jgi:hypothetical protein
MENTKRYTKENIKTVAWEDLDSILSYDLRKLEGQILTLVETLGLENKREKSIKDLVHTFFGQGSFQISKEMDSVYCGVLDLLFDSDSKVIYQCFGQSNKLPDNTDR